MRLKWSSQEVMNDHGGGVLALSYLINKYTGIGLATADKMIAGTRINFKIILKR